MRSFWVYYGSGVSQEGQGDTGVHSRLRPYLTTGLACATAGVVAIAPPLAQQLTEVPVASAATALTAGESLPGESLPGESLLNVPLNLFQAIFNIPYNEVRALEVAAQSLLFTGPWFVGSPTNVWGEDPGDPGHFEALIDLAIPFPQISGLGHEGDYSYLGLGQQISMLAAVEAPAHPSCESLDCLPVLPTAPITGLTSWDQGIWGILIATGLQKFPLFNSWFQVPLSDLTQGDGYYFSPGAPASIDSGPAYAYPGFPWPGTRNPSPEELAQHPNLTAETNLMPWAGTYFKMDLGAPFQNFFTSLQQPFDPNNFELFNPLELARALQAVLAGLILDFNPFIYGSPVCPGLCQLPDGSQTYYGFINFIDGVWPGNKFLHEWLSLYAEDKANVSTPEIRDYLTWVWRHDAVPIDLYNQLPPPYGNTLPPDAVIDTGKLLPTMNQVDIYIADRFGPGLQVFLDNVGILGPFDFGNLVHLFLPFVPSDPGSVSGPPDFPAGIDSMMSLMTPLPG